MTEERGPTFAFKWGPFNFWYDQRVWTPLTSKGNISYQI